MENVAIRLDEPPRVANIGVGVHGVTGPCDVFRLPGLWQLHLYAYEGELTLGGTVHRIRPGRVSLVPPDTEVRYRYRGRSEHLYAHFALSGSGDPRTVPVMQDAGADAPLLSTLLRRGVAAMPGTPAKAAAAAWAALWQVVELSTPERPGGLPPAVAAAMAHIEAHLAEPLTVPDIAQVAGVSHNHLTRLFRAETGSTVIAHIRRRRLERARHLLRASTLAIPAVAAAVGIPDLQAFNKACHRELGGSPRAVRAAAPSPRPYSTRSVQDQR
ncbi:helix-turn-helix domain-containing protein [Streptomyces sp. NPDC002730]|uniref:AraC family transcriptional regulator n=1 Tax=Streptomyces sp. NPDC002730 TaxID=3364662 RepID=UPI0036C57178